NLVLFNSIYYLLFFPVVFAVYWLSPVKWRRLLLLVASYVFYMSWIPRYGLLLLALTVLNYFLGMALGRWTEKKKAILLAGLLLNVGALCYFKYAGFLAGSFGFTLNILLPLG